MRIEQLQLIAFGPFTRCTIDLNAGLNILYGPNEAGKSSALRAVHALLFGVPTRTADDFLHGYRQLRVGGVLVRGADERLECVRRKGNKATLRDRDDDKQLDESVLDAFLGAVDEEFFRSVFGINHERLRAGGEEVLRGEGRIGELLFAAGGVSHLRELQLRLDNEATGLFKPRAHQPRINQAASRLDQLRSEIRQAQASGEEWARHDAARTQQFQQAEELRVALTEAEAARERLLRVKSAWPTLGSWKANREELRKVEGAVLLPEDAEKRSSEAHAALSLAESNLRQARQQRARIDEQLDKLQTPTTLLSEQRRIDDLYRRFGSHEKNAEDRATLDARRRAARNNARKTLERLGWSDSLDDLAKRRPADDKKVVVRSLAKRHGELLQRLDAARKSGTKTQRRLDELRTQLAGISSGAVAKGLTSALSEAKSLREASRGLPARREEVQRLRIDAERSLACLPLFSGSLDELMRLKAPVEAVVEEFDARRRDIATRLQSLQTRMAEDAASESRFDEELAALEKGDSVPTEEELVAARALRDRGVKLAVEALGGKDPDQQIAAEFVGEVGEGTSLSAAFQPTVRRADEVVDRLRREAERVAEKAQLVVQRDALRRRAAQNALDLAKVEREQRQYEEEWNARWTETGLTPLSPPEMRAWLRQLGELRESVRGLSTKEDVLDADERRCESALTLLASELSAVGVASHAECLEEFVEAADGHVDSLREARAQREQLTESIASLTQEAEESNEELHTSEEKLVAWRTSWAEAMKFLQLPEDALPEQAEAALSNVEQLFREVDEADGFAGRIYGIDKTAEEFTKAAQELAAVIAPDLASRPVEELAPTLNGRVSEARRVEQLVNTLTEQRQQQVSLEQDAESAAAQARAVLDGLLSEAGGEHLQNLSQAIERSARRRRLSQLVEELQTQLAPHCGVQALDEFEEDAAREDPDQLASKLSEVESRIAELRGQREAALTAAEREASALRLFDGGDEAADKECERQGILAQAEEDVHEYVVTTLAAALLRSAVERYQQRAQGPVLKLASERFRQLTCGAFSGLKTDLDDSGNDILVGVRPEGGTLRVEGMSEGSRDQLYLALRLATLEHWFDHHEPVPFVVDDVLLTFDDARTEATLAALLELSRRTQVLVFTHHEHLVTLARKTGGLNRGESEVHVVSGWNGMG